MHKVIKLNQEALLKLFIDRSIETKKKQKMILKKIFLKLMNN